MADARYRQIHPSEKGSLKDDFIRLILQYIKTFLLYIAIILKFIGKHLRRRNYKDVF